MIFVPTNSFGNSACSAIFSQVEFHETEFERFKVASAPFFLGKDKERYEIFELYKNFKAAFREPGFYQSLEDNSVLVEKLFKRWYPEDKQNLKMILDQLGPKAFPIILDPGIRYRLKNFIRFASNQDPTKSKGAYELRESYSKHLGTHRVYRGIRLARDKIDETIKGGLSPLSGYSPQSFRDTSAYHFIKLFFYGPNGDIFKRLDNQTYGIFSQSFTGIRTLAEAFAIGNLKNMHPIVLAEVPLLITAEIPKLDTIDLSQLSAGRLSRHTWKGSFFSANGKWIWGGSKGVEYFVFGPLDPAWIINVSEVTAGAGLGPTKFLGFTVQE